VGIAEAIIPDMLSIYCTVILFKLLITIEFLFAELRAFNTYIIRFCISRYFTYHISQILLIVIHPRWW